MLKPILAAIALLSSTAAWAEMCPASPDILDAETELFTKLQTANAVQAQELNGQLWELWLAAPDAKAQKLLDDGMQALRLGDFGFAEDTLDALIAYCPEYSEGYNQRAFTHYLQFQYAEAIPLLDAALERRPRHLGVLTGKALTYVALGDVDAAQAPLRFAVELNPWLSERALLVEPLGEEL